jgi:hypothetical protein
VDLPATLNLGKGSERMERSLITVLKFAPSLGEFSISDTAHGAAHRLFARGSSISSRLSKSTCCLLPAASQKVHETLEVKSTLGSSLNYPWRTPSCQLALIGR